MRAPGPADGLAGHLAVVDMQRVFADPDSPWAVPGFDHAAEGIRRLLPLFGDRVSFTRFLAPETPHGSWTAYYAQWPFALRPPHARLWQLADAFAETDAFAERARHMLDATTFSKWGPELAERVGTGGRLVLTGVSTDCCVLSTALAAADAGVGVRVVADACAGVDADSHETALRVMELYRPMIQVTTVADLLAGGAP
ncbi:cysteine hydrolase family protein [Streptomyces sp. NPDC002537]